jgi:hypothetical protein
MLKRVWSKIRMKLMGGLEDTILIFIVQAHKYHSTGSLPEEFLKHVQICIM